LDGVFTRHARPIAQTIASASAVFPVEGFWSTQRRVILTAPVLHLFGRQRGVASNEQLRLHMSRSQLSRATALGLMTVELPAVKRLAGVPIDVRSRVMAMSLFVGDRGFVSGMTAARAHGVRAVPRAVLELTIAESKSVVLPSWVKVVRTSWGVTEDRMEMGDGRVVASPLRTLFRCAAECSDVRFEKIAEQLWHRQLITPSEAAAYLRRVRRSGRSGVARFERWLEKASGRPRPSQSGLEVDLATMVVALGLPEPVRQYELTLLNGESIHLDLAWPPARLGVEPGDSWWHGGNLAMRRDYARDRACDEMGWRVLRFDEVEMRDVTSCARQVARIYRQRLRLQQLARPGAENA
jgi:hypothetical protein